MKLLPFIFILLASVLQVLPVRAQISETATGAFTADRIYGDVNAPVTIVEYASLGCSHCRTFHEQVWPEFKKTYVDTGKVQFIFRELPFHLPDLRAVTLARCGGPERYDTFIDVLFANQDKWIQGNQTMPTLNALALQGGITVDAYAACQADQKLQQSILDRRNLAVEAGIQSTPSFQIGDRIFSGVQTMEDWADILGNGSPQSDNSLIYIILAIAALAGVVFYFMRRKTAKVL